ncbi:MAG: BON domain-containing protein [Neisseriaceae bacterium]|nr:BON domain-containing protein [Neisseriaceae bacterium]
MMKTWLRLLILSLVIHLSGCTLLAFGTGATIGGLSASDRRTTGAQADDQMMELTVGNQIRNYLKVQGADRSDISVVSYNRNILLMGYVATEEQRQTAERTARAQQAANKVYNYITVGDASASVTQDTWITSKVRAMLLRPNGFMPNHVKVVTYGGVTYAMGILTPEEQEAATNQIRTVSGVQKVVVLYETFNALQR